MLTLKWEDFDEEEHDLPAKFDVCSNCKGHGSHLNESMRNHAYSADEMAEFEEEEREEYSKRGGIYDVTCETCEGKRVEKVVDEDKCDPALLKLYQETEAQRSQWRAEEAQEQRMEARMLGEW